MAQPRFDASEPGGREADAVVERRLTPVAPAPKPVVVQRASLPVPMKKAATAMAIGAAVQVGGSLAMRYLASQAGKRAAASLLAKGLKAAAENRMAASNRPARRGQPRRDITQRVTDDEPELISEILIVRRVWMRRRRD